LRLIKACPEQPPIEYKWNPNDVCLNTKDCYTFNFWTILTPFMKPKICECKGKHEISCNSDYCAVNQKACNELKESKKSHIKLCKKF